MIMQHLFKKYLKLFGGINMKSNNNFYGKINEKDYKYFMNILSQLKSTTIEENIEQVSEILDDEFWHKVFIQNDEKEFDGSIKLILDKDDDLYSDSNIAKTLESFGTFILSADKKKDNPDWIRTFNHHEIEKKGINELNFVQHLEETLGRTNSEFVISNVNYNYKLKREFDMTTKDLAEINELFGDEYPIIRGYYNLYLDARKQLKKLNDLSKERGLTQEEKAQKRMWTNSVKTYKEDILESMKQLVQPLKFKAPLPDSGCPSWDEFDEKDEEHIRYALKISKDNIDISSDLYSIVMDLDKTISLCIEDYEFTDTQLKVLELYRDNATQEEIAKELGIKQQVVNKHINAICKIISEKNWEIYEDWYYLEIAKGTYKKCKCCGEVKLISRFDKDAKGAMGVKATCKKCRKAKKANK
jgi:predicted DNA-binding protein YlxM (UPF0122 family)